MSIGTQGMGLPKASGFLLVAALLLVSPRDLIAQKLSVGDPFEEYVRVLQLIGEADAAGFNLRPVTVPRLDGDVKHPWSARLSDYEPTTSRLDARVASPSAEFGWVSTRPIAANDGFLWQGRGISTTWKAGAFIRYSVLSVAFRPGLAYVQNRDFNTGPGSPNRYYGRTTIDAPRRFGAEPLVLFHPGESSVELSAFGAAVGASTANMWWGPATENPIVMSNNAPGFRHAYLKTARPINAKVLDVDAKWFWGNLYESDYFDDIDENDRRFVTGLAVEIQPHFIPDLYLGATRVFVQATDEEPTLLRDYFVIFQNPFKARLGGSHDPFGFDKNDQMASVFGRWIFPESGFGVYGEIARGDHNRDLRHALVQIKFATGYTIGLSKVFRLHDSHLFGLNVEITRLEASRSDLIRSGVATSQTNFYANEIVRQGYTHRGQIVGASIGPGSNSQHLSADLYAKWGKAGWYAKRVVYDNDLLYGIGGDAGAHQVEFISGLKSLVWKRPFEFTVDVSLRRFLNLFYERDNDEWNAMARIGIRWAIGSYR